MSGRDSNGRFAVGNHGGPGRPRRVVEVEYLDALSDAVGLHDWREIAQRAVSDAKNGDATARAWLTKHLLPEKPGGLMDLAVAEHDDRSVDDQIAAVAKSREGERRRHEKMAQLFDGL